MIGFGGRVIGEGEPKYLNSPETPLFEKGRELYGLYQARRAIRDANQVLVVEGYMDVVALAQHGVENAVATLGTATTPIHVDQAAAPGRQRGVLLRRRQRGAQGRVARARGLRCRCWPTARLVSFLFLPPEDDPTRSCAAQGKDAFVKAARRGQAAVAVPASPSSPRRVDMETEEGRARFLAEARPLVVADRGAGPGGDAAAPRWRSWRASSPEEIAALVPVRTPVAARPRRACARAPRRPKPRPRPRMAAASPACC